MGSEEPLDCTLTVGALYETTHHKILRLYICSKKSDDSDLSDSSAQAKSPERFPDSRGSHLTRSFPQIFLSYHVTWVLLELSVLRRAFV